MHGHLQYLEDHGAMVEAMHDKHHIGGLLWVMSWPVVSQYNGEDDTDTQMEDAGRQTKITLKPEAQICPSSRDAAR